MSIFCSFRLIYQCVRACVRVDNSKYSHAPTFAPAGADSAWICANVATCENPSGHDICTA